MLPRLHLDFARWKKDPRVAIRVALGVLLVANLVAAAFAFKPWASSPEELARQAASMRRDLKQKQGDLERIRSIVEKVASARTDGDRFMEKYLLGTRSLASTLVLELERMARKSGIRQKDTTFAFEPVEGSDTLSKVSITAIYEGSYADLMQFMNQLDRSERLLIVETLGAAPQQAGTLLGVTMKFSAFVQEGGEPPAEQPAAITPVASTMPPPAPARPLVAPVAAPINQPRPALQVSPPPSPPPAPIMKPQGPPERPHSPYRRQRVTQ